MGEQNNMSRHHKSKNKVERNNTVHAIFVEKGERLKNIKNKRQRPQLSKSNERTYRIVVYQTTVEKTKILRCIMSVLLDTT